MIDPVNGLFDIPDYENTEDEIFPPLPPPMSPGQEDGEGDHLANGDEGEVSKLAEVPVAKRRLVKRPQPKLDSQRLVSEKGLPALRTLFDDVRFKGKGHEGQDLKVLMQKMENWAHRLYPRLQFDDFVDKLETLGSKREVQTCLKRIRLDMPLTHEDFTGQDGEEGTSGGLHPAEPDPFSQLGFMGNGPAHSTPAGTSLSEEQRQRIELNKRLALERRLARHQEQLNASQLAGPGTEDPPGSSGPSHSQGNEDRGLTDHMGDGGECGSASVVDRSHDMTNGSD